MRSGALSTMPQPEQGDAGNLDSFAVELLQDAPCGILVTDPDGGLVLANRTLAHWLRRSDAELASPVRIKDLLTMPGRIFFDTHVAPMLRLQGHVREIACQFERRDAPPLHVLLNGVMRTAPDGTPTRVDYTIFDATERALYEASLREARSGAEQLAAIVTASPDAILRVGASGIVQRWNRGAEAMFGLGATEASGRRVEELVRLEGSEGWFAAHRRDALPIKRFEAVDAEGRDLAVMISVIGDAEDPGADWSIVLRDVTERARAERRLQLVNGELNHRVKNTLSVVSGIARQTLSSEDSLALGQRLQALARAHEVLTGAQWDSVALRELVQITAEEAGGPERFSFDGPDLELSPQHATTLSMALHELTTNALKYGALSCDGGVVTVAWRLEPGDAPRLHLSWRESGGPVVVPPTRKGFGTKMINRVLAAEFSAEVRFDFAPDGVCCEIGFPYG